jgi:3-oxoacyl-[acyl-carrier protein] reductase
VGSDLSAPEGAASLASQVREIVGKRLDIFVSNAGISKAATTADHSIADFDGLFATNVRSPFFLVKELMPLFSEGSAIVLVSSLAARAVTGNLGLPGTPAIPAYAATKGALDTLVKHWAAAFGPQGIRVNAVSPGVIDTDASNFTKTEWSQCHALHASAQAYRPARGRSRRNCFYGLRPRALDHGAIIPVDGGSKL